MSHDFAAQRAETQAVYTDLQDQHGLPDEADVDYFLVPDTADSDWRPLADALSREGYDCQWDEEESYLTATLPDQIVSADGIWIGEEVATRLALEHGFHPDGWGLMG